MRRIRWLALVAALIVGGLGVWAASTTQRVEAAIQGETIDPFQIMLNARDLPVDDVASYMR